MRNPAAATFAAHLFEREVVEEAGGADGETTDKSILPLCSRTATHGPFHPVTVDEIRGEFPDAEVELCGVCRRAFDARETQADGGDAVAVDPTADVYGNGCVGANEDDDEAASIDAEADGHKKYDAVTLEVAAFTAVASNAAVEREGDLTSEPTNDWYDRAMLTVTRDDLDGDGKLRNERPIHFDFRDAGGGESVDALAVLYDGEVLRTVSMERVETGHVRTLSFDPGDISFGSKRAWRATLRDELGFDVDPDLFGQFKRGRPYGTYVEFGGDDA
jgi:hypothetical protein